jgi:hypothetical protein
MNQCDVRRASSNAGVNAGIHLSQSDERACWRESWSGFVSGVTQDPSDRYAEVSSLSMMIPFAGIIVPSILALVVGSLPLLVGIRE